MKRSNSVFSFFLVLVIASSLLFGLGGVRRVEAKSVTWNGGVSGRLYYAWTYKYPDLLNLQLIDETSRSAALKLLESQDDTDLSQWDHVADVLPGLRNPQISINYGADAKDALGNALLDRANVPVGSQIKFHFKSYENSDISWGGTGYAIDTPYGRWVAGAQSPTVPLGRDKVVFSGQYGVGTMYREKHVCDPYDYISSQYINPSIYTTNSDGLYWLIYIPLSVNPPTKPYPAISPNLTCGTQDPNGDVICTVNAVGTITASMKFDATYGRFYYRRYEPRTLPSPLLLNPGCYGSNIPMDLKAKDLRNYYQTKSGFTIPIPTQTINFTFNAVPGNNPPTPPIVTGPATGKPNISYSFKTASTDVEGDPVRYEFNWNNDGTTISLVPTDGITYVSPCPSPLTLENINSCPSAVSSNYSWLDAGGKTFQVRARDNKGGVSGWTSYTIAIQEDGICGSANTKSFSIAPTTNLCLKGTASPVPSGPGPWNWTCNGLGGGANASCSANTCQPVNDYGSCECSGTYKEQKRHEFGTTCDSTIEYIDCAPQEKNSCRDFNWKEVAP
jgi:hypothetical protein